jgi:hypothetical protein
MSEITHHLWDIEHPYYCNEGNYFKCGLIDHHDSWASFAETMGNSDPELNLLFRWDWQRLGLDEGEWDGTHQLLLFFVAQRKGFFFSNEVQVSEADEPAIREWLADRSQHTMAFWGGFQCKT